MEAPSDGLLGAAIRPANMLRVKIWAGEMEKPKKNKYHAVEERKVNKVKLF